MSNEFFCKVCEITCNGKAPYEQHLKSAKHLKKAKLTESLTPSDQPTASSFSTAAATTTTTTNLFEDSSISSSSITISPETMRILLEWNHPLGYKPYCDICYLPLHGENNADLHFNSNNNIHTQKLTAWKQIQENDAKYSCKICSEIFSNEYKMREHFLSDSHANTIQQKNYLQKFIEIYKTYNKLIEVRMEKNDHSDISTTSHINENLSNLFEKLNVIDGTESKLKSSKPSIFSEQKFNEIMKNTTQNVDD